MIDRPARLILVVEDEPDVQTVIRLALGDLPGVEVITAGDGAEALRLLERVRPDVIVLDVHLPVVDGYAVARQLKSNPGTRSIPILGVSAVARAADVLAAGCDAFLSKPFELDDLLASVSRWLGV